MRPAIVRRSQTRPPRRVRRWSQGFSLIELLIALAVLGSAFTALLSAHASASRLENQARYLLEATSLAQEILTETEVNGLPVFNKDSGDFGESFPGYKWEREVADGPLPEWFPELKEVTVRVLWNEGKRARSKTLVCYYLKRDK